MVSNLVEACRVVFCLSLLSLYAVASVNSTDTSSFDDLGQDPDVGLDMIQIVESKGFVIEEHFVTTDDGYILGVFRIPCGASETDPVTKVCKTKDASPRPVVFLQHGLLDSSYAWVCNFADQSFAFMLADAGYDVWMGNNRGTTWSKRHTTLDTSSHAFWTFSWDDMAAHDMPSQLRYVLDTTGVQTLSYAGHSEGTIQAFSGFTLPANAWLLERVDVFIALAPVAYVSHLSSPVFNVLAGVDLAYLLNLFGSNEFLPTDTIITKLAPGLCDLLPTGCAVMLELIAGQSNNLNTSRISVYASQTPAGTSTQNMVQWTEGTKEDKFSMYDYGCGLFSCANKEHYGQKTPPLYDLSAMTVPVALYSGTADSLADPTDVARLRQELPAGGIVADVVVAGFAHLDFTWGVDANRLVYAPAMEVIEQAKAGKFQAL